MDQDLEAWRQIWCRLQGQATAPWRNATTPSVDLHPITALEIEEVARPFTEETSVGCDHFPPRQIASASSPLRSAIAQFLNAVERTGNWPEDLAVALIHLIPKPDGGRRPIGVQPTIVRIWERIRKPIVQR